MKTFNIYRNLTRLNSLPADEAITLFLSISGSEKWANEMAKRRPFQMLDNLFDSADEVWSALNEQERILAFERLRVAREQKPRDISAELEDADRLYRDKFGFVFVYNGDESGWDETLAVCKARLRNSYATEMQLATNEHLKRIEGGLADLLER